MAFSAMMLIHIHENRFHSRIWIFDVFGLLRFVNQSFSLPRATYSFVALPYVGRERSK